MRPIERIMARRAPCTCGCRGKDSWHQTYYKRKITNVREGRVIAHDGKIVLASGLARFPWGEEPVRFTAGVLDDGREYEVGWEIDRS